MLLSHSGDIGDLIAALAAVRQLAGGPHRLALRPEPYSGNRMTRKRYDNLRGFLEAQPCVAGVEYREGRGEVDLDLDQWRQKYNSWLSIADMTCSALGLPHWPREQPWLEAEPRRVARVLVARSARYQNWNAWELYPRALAAYGPDVAFVGTYEEHEKFVAAAGPVAYWPTPTLLDLARAVAGCDLFVGNQSAPLWLALGLHVPTVQEVCVEQANCHFERENALYARGAGLPLPALEDLSGRRERNERLRNEQNP